MICGSTGFLPTHTYTHLNTPPTHHHSIPPMRDTVSSFTMTLILRHSCNYNKENEHKLEIHQPLPGSTSIFHTFNILGLDKTAKFRSVTTCGTMFCLYIVLNAWTHFLNTFPAVNSLILKSHNREMC